MAIYVNVGEKEENWSSGKQCMKVLERRDVPTSRRWVNQYKIQQAVTSQRINVATSQCRDVATSRRQLEICPPSLKVPRVQNSRYREAYELGHIIPEQQRDRLPRRAHDLYCFPFFGQ